jgi:hypothetical protein
MRVSLSGNIDQVIGATARLHPQFRFAAAKALTLTLRGAQQLMPAAATGALDRPTAFTLRGFYAQSAQKDNLQASVGVKDLQAKYLGYQVQGGTRAPNRLALRLPSTVALDESGNLPKGVIARLIAAAKSGRKLGKRLSSRAGLSQDVQLFYGKPRGTNLPAGIYRREKRGSKSVLVPVIVFPRQSATYQPRFDFYAVAHRHVVDTFDATLARTWSEALATAR